MMSFYSNEDVMWQRLKDLQLEAANRRLVAQNSVPAVARLARLLGQRAWLLAGLAMRRAPRRRPLGVIDGESDAAANHAA
jgi:hypothetical protein